MNKENETIQESKKLRSMQELADFLGCSLVSAFTYVKAGKIPHYKVGRTRIFDTNEVLEAIKQPVKI